MVEDYVASLPIDAVSRGTTSLRCQHPTLLSQHTLVMKYSGSPPRPTALSTHHAAPERRLGALGVLELGTLEASCIARALLRVALRLCIGVRHIMRRIMRRIVGDTRFRHRG